MGNQIFGFVLSLLLWVFLGYRFLRAFIHRKLTTGASLFAWTIFFLCYLVVALDVPSVEAQINVHFAGLPVATLLRGEVILLTANLYFLGTRDIDRPSPRIKQIFSRLNPLIMLFILALFVMMAYSQSVSDVVILHTVKVVREATMLVWTPLVLWPTLVQVRRLENYRPMKLRYTVSLIFYASFVLNCASGIVWSFTLFFLPSLQAQALIINQLSAVICLIQFLVMLFPFRWLMLIFYPGQLHLYIRLRRLHSAVKNFSTVHTPVYRLSFNLLHTTDIELAIYQQVIEILDMYLLMSQAGEPLRRDIQAVTESEPQYNELVEKLAAIQI